jgi:hypothetical protein
MGLGVERIRCDVAVLRSEQQRYQFAALLREREPGSFC